MIGWIVSVLECFLLAAAVYLAGSAFRHAFFSIAAVALPRRRARSAEPRFRFVVLIPAHDEEHGIVETIASAKRLDYPPDRMEIVVLADNCTDDTADVARAAGVRVFERQDSRRPGKPYALDWFIRSRDWSDDDALVCLDADSTVDSGYLSALNDALVEGARAVQGYNGAKDPGRSALAALSVLTNTMKNAGTYAGRAALGLPAPMMNGWCLSGEVLRRFGWQSFTVAEDFEQSLRLGIWGAFPRFVDHVRVRSEKAGSFRKAASQRARWSAGQSTVGQTLGRFAAREALRRRSWSLWELAMDVRTPGYATATAGLVVLLGGTWIVGPPSTWIVAMTGISSMVVCVAVGFLRSESKTMVLKGLLLAPYFIVWKSSLALRSRLRPPSQWKRADRNRDGRP